MHINKLNKNSRTFFDNLLRNSKDFITPFKMFNNEYKKKNKYLYYPFVYGWIIFISPLSLLVFIFLTCMKYICLFILNFVGMFSGASMEFFKKPDPFGDILKGVYKFFAYLLCIPFTSETKKFGTLNRKNNINNNNSRNKNLEKKCGGWWLVWGSIMLGYLLISLMIGPGALIGLVILIPSLHFFTLQLNKSIEDFDKIKYKKYVNNNNTNNDTKITRKELIKKTPFKRLINKFILLIFFNIVITLILAAAI